MVRDPHALYRRWFASICSVASLQCQSELAEKDKPQFKRGFRSFVCLCSQMDT